MSRPATSRRSYDVTRVPGFAEEHLPLTIIHPTQFQDIWRGAGQSPERELAAAVLENAANDLRNHRYARRRRRQRYYMQAYQWVISEDREWPFSFVNLCEFLKLSPAALREEMLREAAPKRSSEIPEQREAEAA